MAQNHGSVRLQYLPRSLDRVVSVSEREREGRKRAWGKERGDDDYNIIGFSKSGIAKSPLNKRTKQINFSGLMESHRQ